MKEANQTKKIQKMKKYFLCYNSKTQQNPETL